jgi:hypothetical protein
LFDEETKAGLREGVSMHVAVGILGYSFIICNKYMLMIQEICHK